MQEQLQTKAPVLSLLLSKRAFWLALGSVGYLISLYAILFGLGYGSIVAGFPLVFVPLLFPKWDLSDRLIGVALCGVFAYIVYLVVLIQQSYFPDTASMVVELFFVLLVTIPAFLLRGPLYAVFGIGSVDQFLIIFGALFLSLFILGVRAVPRMQTRTRLMMFAVIMVSIFVTFNECIYLGLGIRNLTAIETTDPTVRNYYRVATTD